MNKPQISVIVPVFDSEKYLHKCIDSILSQTFSGFELVLINDGSTDSSGKICDEYAFKDSRVRVFHKENGGVSAARNTGIKAAKGKYVTFVDADDKVKSSFLMDFNSLELEADFYVQGYIEWVAPDKFNSVYIINESAFSTDLNQVIEKLDIEHSVLEAPWGKLFKLEILSKNNHLFNEELSNAEDHLFVMEYLKYIRSIVVCHPANYYYRKFNNENSLSHKFISHDKLHLYASAVYEARLCNIENHSMSERYRTFTINVHNDLLTKSLIKLFHEKTKLTKTIKKELINEYLLELDHLGMHHQLRKVKKHQFIKKVWNSGLPFKLAFLEKVLPKL